MIIDGHVHLLPRKVRADRGPFCQSDSGFGPLYSSEKARLVSEEEIIDYLDRYEIEKAVVFGFPWEDRDLIRENNDQVWDFRDRYPERIVPFAVLSPSYCGKPELEAERALEAGFAGIGELAVYRRGWTREDFVALTPTLEMATQHNVPVLVHVNEPVGHPYPGKVSVDFDSLFKTIQTHPDLNFILAHWGGGVFVYALMPEIREMLSHTFVDIAASPFLYSPRIFPVAQAILGTEKIIFGSDFPLLSLPRYIKQMDEARLTGPDKNLILGENLFSLLFHSSSQSG